MHIYDARNNIMKIITSCISNSYNIFKQVLHITNAISLKGNIGSNQIKIFKLNTEYLN